MLGYDISWAGFNIIEVMSSSKFTLKRIGYLAASQSFHCDSELLMLTTNMIRKELNSQNQYEAGLALTSLSCFVSTDLARDLANDILTLLSSTKPYIRKKAVLMMYKVFLKYPEALRPAFPRLKEKLEDPDPGVQSAAVNVVCELARKNPKNYLSLAPVFFKLMTTSTNNWMLIKIIKLFGALTPLEPRLGKKLIEPLTNLIHSTSAMSLLYECINTVIAVLISISSGMPNHAASIQLCVQKLRILIEDSDQNLKYLGLLAMSKILKTHPKSVQAHKDLILQCLEDKDESIRLRALDLLYGMVSKKNLMEIVKKLMVHMDKAEGTVYRDELLSKIILICSQNNYQFITNFEWYITVLVELAQMEFGSKQGHVIGAQLMDVCIRVQAIRPFAVAEMAQLLDVYTSTSQFTIMQEVLYAAAWLCGEFVIELKNPEQTLHALLRYKSLPQHIESVFIQNILKVFAYVIDICYENDQQDEICDLCDMVVDKMNDSIKSGELEVQERASNTLIIVQIVKEEITAGKTVGIMNIMNIDDPLDKAEPTESVFGELLSLFSGELNPVAPKAQKKVPIPEGLDLDAQIYDEPVEESESDSEPDSRENLFVKTDRLRSGNTIVYQPEPTEEEIKKSREARKQEQLNNPHYLKSDSIDSNTSANTETVDGVPIAELALNVPLKTFGEKRSDKYLNLNADSGKSKKKGKKKKKKYKSESSSDENIDVGPIIEIKRGMELPEGATLSDSESDRDKKDDLHKALDIDLTPDTVFSDFGLRTPHLGKQKEDAVGRDVKKGKSHSKKKQGDKEKSSKKKDKAKKSVIETKEDNLLALDSDNEKQQGDKRPKKAKKEKKDKKKSKDKESKGKSKMSSSGYEEATGISTPSKEFQ
ncbi:unnamed protein product [Acanthoscelides obtectus]|nr:unnamed protein product [Acanthoscelides obtectus]CAK1659259.1 AP-3 complex subunit delta [Acanthoscelides obtectus]